MIFRDYNFGIFKGHLDLRFFTERQLESRQVQTDSSCQKTPSSENSKPEKVDEKITEPESEEDEELCTIFMAYKNDILFIFHLIPTLSGVQKVEI